MKTKKIMEDMDAHKLNQSNEYNSKEKPNNNNVDNNVRQSRTTGVAGENRRSPSNSLEVKNNSYDGHKLTNDDIFLKSNITK